MNMDENFWAQFDLLPRPSTEETLALGQIEAGASVLLDKDGGPGEQYLEVQKLYRLLFGSFLIAKSGLDQLDERLAKEGFRPRGDEETDYYQKYDLMGLHFFYLRSYLHVERLSEAEAGVFTRCLAERDGHTLLAQALDVVSGTYLTVLEVSPEHPQQQFELFPNIHGIGRVSGDTIAVALSSRAGYDGQGMLLDQDAELRRVRVLDNVQRQLEPILKQVLQTNVFVMVEV